MEHDANTIKSPMVAYLEQLHRVLEQNREDVDELTKVQSKLSADRINLAALETKIAEQLSYIRNLVAKKNEIADILGRTIRERKEG